MRYEIFGDPMPAVTITLGMGESIVTQAGAMSWMSDGIEMQTNARGGLLGGLGRVLAGESIFLVSYTSVRENTHITMASTFVGNIMPVYISPGQELICQKNSFLCAQEGVDLSLAFGRAKTGFFGGEGFVMQRLSGSGLAFLELDGTVVEKQLSAGEVLKINTGNIAAFESGVRYDVERIRGFKNVLFGGEGLFVSTLEGPGKVYLQTMNIQSFADRLVPFLPQKSSD